jgi:RNA polymerase sigma-70 factor (ECF subfamily)
LTNALIGTWAPERGASATALLLGEAAERQVVAARARQEEASDETLMRQFQAGDQSAFAALMRRHLPGVFHFVARHTSSRTADDLAQEVFLRVVERAKTFNHEARFSTWLYAIARNLCVDTLRKMAHRQHPSLDEPSAGGGTLSDKIGDEHPEASAERAAGSSELGHRIDDALRELPEEQREVFLLREVANLPFSEIARMTGVPENTVKSRMRYALTRLRDALAEYEREAKALT